MLTPNDLGGDEDTARRVLVSARDIAPCIDSFEQGSEEFKNALAILKGVLAEIPKPGSRRTRSMSRNGTSISYDATDFFTKSDVRMLRALCPRADDAGHSSGSFPAKSVASEMWPEGEYS